MTEIRKTKDHHILALLNEEVQSLHAQLYPDIFKSYDRYKTEQAFERMLRLEGAKAFVAFNGEEAIGYILFFVQHKKESAFQFEGSSIYIDQILVKESHRSQGIGKQLLQKVKEIAQSEKITTIRADYWSKNISAGNFFSHSGFECRREIRELKL